MLPVALLIIGTNALIAMLLPYAAESFPLRIRGRTTGTVAACTKARRNVRPIARDPRAGAAAGRWFRS